MVALYLSATHCTVSLDSATKQILVINHSFKKHSVKLEVKSQITLNVYNLAVRPFLSALHLRL